MVAKVSMMWNWYIVATLQKKGGFGTEFNSAKNHQVFFAELQLCKKYKVDFLQSCNSPKKNIGDLVQS